MIMPYFGNSWPNYFPLYIESCTLNPQVDFLFFTDIPQDFTYPSNVRFMETTLEEVASLAGQVIGQPVVIQNPYKLCDLKPAYGHIFQKYIVGYDFWGYGDIDVIYGKWVPLIKEQMLLECDIISFRPYWMSGALAIIRNEPATNLLYQESKSWERVFSSNIFFSFGVPY